jgi:hypothetical protein
MASSLVSEESDDQFFDADSHLSSSKGNGTQVVPAMKEEDQWCMPQLVDMGVMKERRTALDIPRGRTSFGLWKFLKHFLGHDLTRVTMPVHINEPLSFTQRIVEDLEYSDLLHKAAETDDRFLRLAYLASSSCSMWSTTLSRHSKPFNPLLGETFEYVRPDLGYHCITEQVSHHPPVTAVHANAEKWTAWEQYTLDIKFRGQWCNVTPVGIMHYRPKCDNFHYYWNKPVTTIHNLIFGELWADHEGDVFVRCHETGDYAKVVFSSYSSVGRKYKEIRGGVYNAKDKQVLELRGAWHTHFEYRRLDVKNSDWVRIWTAAPRIDNWEKQFGFTLFSLTLNELDKTVTCPTDSRFRPDQRYLEDNDLEKAAEEKHRLEEKQRAARRIREETGETWSPVWFEYKLDEDLNISYFTYNGRYWNAKLKNDYSACPDIF